MTPRVIHDDESELIIEEGRFGPLGLAILFVILASLFLVPAALTGSLAGWAIESACAVVVAAVLFQAALAQTGYRRLEIRPGSEVVLTLYRRVRRPISVRIRWELIERVVCQRIQQPEIRDEMRVKMRLLEEKAFTLLDGWYSTPVVEALERHFQDLFSVVKCKSRHP